MEIKEVLAECIIPVPQISKETNVMKYLDHIKVECSFLPEKKVQKKNRRLLDD